MPQCKKFSVEPIDPFYVHEQNKAGKSYAEIALELNVPVTRLRTVMTKWHPNYTK